MAEDDKSVKAEPAIPVPSQVETVMVLRDCPYFPEDLVWPIFSLLMAMVEEMVEDHPQNCDCTLEKVAEATLRYMGSRRNPGYIGEDEVGQG